MNLRRLFSVYRFMRVLALCGIVGGALCNTVRPAFAIDCLDGAQQQAFHIRALQSDLMVAALNCNQNTQYRDFIRQHGSALKASSATLQRYFDGRGGTYRMDKYITSLANKSSTDAIAAGRDYCGMTSALYQQVLASDNDALYEWLADNMNSRNYPAPSCTNTASIK